MLAPPIRLFSASVYFSMGITALLPDADWDVTPCVYDFSDYRSGDAAYYLISLTGCASNDVSLSLQWLQRMSYQLSFPALLFVDEASPLICQQTAGTNTVVIDGKNNPQKTREMLLQWLKGELLPSNSCRADTHLNAKEWGVLNRYLLVQDMSAVAKWMNFPVKTAYYWRKRALSKLGFRHINDFVRHYPVGKPMPSH